MTRLRGTSARERCRCGRKRGTAGTAKQAHLCPACLCPACPCPAQPCPDGPKGGVSVSRAGRSCGDYVAALERSNRVLNSENCRLARLLLHYQAIIEQAAAACR